MRGSAKAPPSSRAEAAARATDGLCSLPDVSPPLPQAFAKPHSALAFASLSQDIVWAQRQLR